MRLRCSGWRAQQGPRAARGLTLALLAALLTACSASIPAAPTSKPNSVVAITLSDGGCAPDPASAPAGEVMFRVTNSSGNGVSEFDVQRPDGAALALQQNLAPGHSGSIIVWLDAGEYQVACPGAVTSTYPFRVTGSGRPAWNANPLLVAAHDTFLAYLQRQATALASQVAALAATTREGNVAASRAAYLQARVTYEHLAPALPADLDRAMNGGLGSFGAGQRATGFHVVERALWLDGSASAAAAATAALLPQATQVVSIMAGAAVSPADIAAGATSGLTLAVTSRLTGEEEPFSHLGLLMMQADLDAATQGWSSLRAAVAHADGPLAATLDSQVAGARSSLAAVEQQGGSGFPDDTSLPPAQSRALAGAFNTLNASMSQVAVVVE